MSAFAPLVGASADIDRRLPTSTRAGCRAVRDSTLVAWYRCLYAPRTGGAYDSHHRTAGIAGRTRRRGGVVAARGGRAATGKDHRVLGGAHAFGLEILCSCVCAKAERTRLD